MKRSAQHKQIYLSIHPFRFVHLLPLLQERFHAHLRVTVCQTPLSMKLTSSWLHFQTIYNQRTVNVDAPGYWHYSHNTRGPNRHPSPLFFLFYFSLFATFLQKLIVAWFQSFPHRHDFVLADWWSALGPGGRNLGLLWRRTSNTVYHGFSMCGVVVLYSPTLRTHA